MTSKLVHLKKLAAVTSVFALVQVTFASAADAVPDIEIPLPQKHWRLLVAAGGDFLVALPEQDGVATVIDLKQKKITARIPYRQGMQVLAGATRVVTYSGVAEHELVRYRLADGVRERSGSLKDGNPRFRNAAMGNETEGPIYISNDERGNLEAVDLETLSKRALPQSVAKLLAARQDFNDGVLVVTPDGKRIWNRGSRRAELLEILGPNPKLTPYDDLHQIGRDGRFVYRTAGVYDAGGELVVPEVDPKKRQSTFYHGSVDGRFLFRSRLVNERRVVQFFVPGGPEPIFELAVTPYLSLHEQSCVAIPRLKMFAVVNTSDVLILKHLDFDAALAGGSGDFFHFAPSDVPTAEAGKHWRYELSVVAKARPLTYRVDLGPTGMEISDAGVMTWTPPDAHGSEVIVSVADPSGRELVRRFVVPGGRASTAAVATSVATPGVMPAIPGAAPPGVARPPAGSAPAEPVVVDAAIGKRELRLAEPAARLWPIAGGQYLAAHLKTARKVVLIDVRSAAIRGEWPLAGEAEPVAFARTRCATFNHADRKLAIVDLETGKTIVEMILDEIPEHFAMGSDGDGPLAVTTKNPSRGASPYRTSFVDLATLKPVQRSSYPYHIENQKELRAGADGLNFSGYRLSTVALANDKPNAEPEYVPLAQRLWMSDSFEYDEGSAKNGTRRVADAKLDLYAAWHIEPPAAGDAESKPAGTVSILPMHRPERLFTVTNLETPAVPRQIPRGRDQADYLSDRRILPLLSASSIVTVPGDRDRLVFHTVDLDEIMPRAVAAPVATDDASASAALPPRPLVISSVPYPITPGVAWKHRLRAYSRAGGISFQLEYAPAGMTIGPTGELDWAVPPRDAPAEPKSDVDVVISVRDAAGEETLHRLKLTLWIPSFDPPQRPGPAPSGIPGGMGGVPPVAAVPPRAHAEIALPAKIGTWSIGGNGRYVVAHLPTRKEVVVVDLGEKKIAATVPVPDMEAVALAAGATKFVVADKSKHTLTRFALPGGAKEASYVVPGFGIGDVALGLASEGPLLVSVLGSQPQTGSQRGKVPPYKVEFYDLASLRPRTMQFTEGKGTGDTGWTASADGRVFTNYYGGVLTLSGNQVRFRSATNGMSPIVPTADGRVLYGEGTFYQNRDQTPVERLEMDLGRRFYPAATGTLVLNYRYYGPNPAGRYWVHVQGSPHGIVELSGLPPAEAESVPELGRGGWTPDMIVGLLPEVDALVILNPKRDALFVYPFNLDEELARSEIDNLFFLSSPPEVIPADRPFSHQVVVKSKRGNVALNLTEGPAGMTLNAAGSLEWPAPVAGDHTLTITARDGSGLETRQSLRINVGGAPQP
jgi:hypothetical protein